MPTVTWGWHKTDGGNFANALSNFQHWAIKVGDVWYENWNTGLSATGKDFEVNWMSHDEFMKMLSNKTRMAPVKYKNLGSTNATHQQIEGWMKEYSNGRKYDLKASLNWPPSPSNKTTGNCQTLVHFLAQKMGAQVNMGPLNGSNYSGCSTFPIPQPGSAPRNKCDVTAGSCTGSWSGASYTSEWCGRCGHWYCPYHAPPSESYKVAGGCHTCYSNSTG
jgi:hypothetical protein